MSLKKPMTEEQLIGWIRYSMMGLHMARRTCEWKGWDFDELRHQAKVSLNKEIAEYDRELARKNARLN